MADKIEDLIDLFGWVLVFGIHKINPAWFDVINESYFDYQVGLFKKIAYMKKPPVIFWGLSTAQPDHIHVLYDVGSYKEMIRDTKFVLNPDIDLKYEVACGTLNTPMDIAVAVQNFLKVEAYMIDPTFRRGHYIYDLLKTYYDPRCGQILIPYNKDEDVLLFVRDPYTGNGVNRITLGRRVFIQKMARPYYEETLARYILDRYGTLIGTGVLITTVILIRKL